MYHFDIKKKNEEGRVPRTTHTILEEHPMTIRAVNPTTGETINTYEEMAPAEVARTIAQAHDAFFSWRQTSVAARAQRMQQAAQILRGQATAYATLMAQEMGKPVKDGRAEVE